MMDVTVTQVEKERGKERILWQKGGCTNERASSMTRNYNLTDMKGKRRDESPLITAE